MPPIQDADSLRNRLVQVAESYVGTREVGNNGGPAVTEFQKAVDGKAEGEPWCMCFVQFCVKETERITGVKSNLFRSEHCLTVWNNTPKTMRRPDPAPGYIVIWRRHGSTLGHTGIVVGIRNREVMITVEGNTTDGQDIEREGDGVFRKPRRIMGNQLFQLVGFLAPFG